MKTKPSLFLEIEGNADLARFIVPKCEDEGICVEVAPDVEPDSLLIIKVDDYYNALGMEFTPKSTDCLVIQHCGSENYKLLIVELKNRKTLVHSEQKDLEEKFHTTLFDFLSDRYRIYFYNQEYSFKTRLLLCAGKMKNGTLVRSYSLDFLLGLKLFTFQGKRIGINGEPPNPTIRPC